jgi:PTS system ascorbate-specific IIA component
MSVGLLLVTHNLVGAALLETATRMLDRCPLMTRALAVTLDSDLEQIAAQARKLVQDVDQGDGVLVLTDMFGSTPANVATRLMRRDRVAVVTGINLPMLVRVLNYAQLCLPELVDKAVSGGRDGVVQCEVDS